jgi:hypothetical protein
MRFEIAYGRIAPLLAATGMPKSKGYMEIGDTDLDVHMSWAFSASIPLTAITSAEPLDNKVMSIGVHGWRGRWLVNGAGHRLVKIMIDPPVKAKAVQFPINLRELTVSVEDPDEFVRALTTD